MIKRPNLEREALSLAVNGFEVFPVAEGKKAPPLVPFTREASSDPNEIAARWREHPGANIGIRAGGGTLVLDVDSADSQRLVEDLEVPETTTASTPREGRHLYLTGRAPTRTAVRPGLDVRGQPRPSACTAIAGSPRREPGTFIAGRRAATAAREDPMTRRWPAVKSSAACSTAAPIPSAWHPMIGTPPEAIPSGRGSALPTRSA